MPLRHRMPTQHTKSKKKMRDSISHKMTIEDDCIKRVFGPAGLEPNINVLQKYVALAIVAAARLQAIVNSGADAIGYPLTNEKRDFLIHLKSTLSVNETHISEAKIEYNTLYNTRISGTLPDESEIFMGLLTALKYISHGFGRR